MKKLKTLDDFTPEIKSKIPEYIAAYTKGVFDGGRYQNFNKEDADSLIHWNYEKCNYKKPVILVAGNPYEAQIFFNHIKKNKEIFTPVLYVVYCLKNGIELPKELSEIAKHSQLDSQLDSQLGSQLRSQLRSQLDSQLGSQLRSQLRSQLDSQLYSQLDSQLGEYNNDYLFTANVYSNYYVGFYKFIKDEFDISAKIGVMLDSWSELYQKSGVYSAIFSELLCVVSKYPKKVHRNANNDMHNLEASAVEWEANTELTRFKCFYINGRNLPENYFNSILAGKFTMEDFINENNEEYKSTCIAFMQEKYGDEYIVNFFRQNLKEVDTFVDKKDKKYLEGTTGGMNVGVYTLFKGEINDENIAYVRCYCPSTDRMFFLGVESKHNSAKDAIASLYRIPSKLKPHIKSISRQGERFSTILTDEGKRALKQMSEQDIASVTHLTGNDYFKLMKYEF